MLDAVPGIDRIRIQGFGCIEELELELGPLQAFIGPNDSGKSTILRAVQSVVTHGVLIGLDPDALRAPSQLIPEGRELGFLSDRGAGLAGLLDALMNRSDRPVAAITEHVRVGFPTVKHIGLRNASTTHKELQIELVDGTKIPASMASEGLLYYLAFAALPYLHTNADVLLIEEPENGLHPARLRDVVATLREISKTTQVLIATHSPILVNELQPQEIFVTTRDSKTGTRVTRLDRTHNFEARARVYHPGELWVAYADGGTEAALSQAGRSGSAPGILGPR